MALAGYGVLKGSVIGHSRDADDDHYQVLVRAGATLMRVAVNVRSSAPKAPSTVLFATTTTLPPAFTGALAALAPGFRPLASRPGGLAIDFLRGGLVKPRSLKPLPPDLPGQDNDLKDALEAAVLRAMKEADSALHAFGVRWGPEKNRKDRCFHFVPGNGVHDIHMNQGNSGRYARDNGTWQDGALVFGYPGDKWRAFFVAFQSQALKTDDKGRPV